MKNPPEPPAEPLGPPARDPRVRGLTVLVGIVLLGLASGVGWFQSKRPAMARAKAEIDAQLAAAPHDPASRLEQWLRFGAPQIHHRLSQFARFSPEHPWLVTHAVRAADGGDPELWGVDCTTLPQEMAHREGLRIVIDLPAPRPLGRLPLSLRMGEHVPLVEPGEGFADAQRLRELARYLLDRIPEALERDIPGSSVEIRVAPAAR